MLFSKFKLGELELDNRIAMAPMTRSRTDQPGDVPNDLMATYYAQRASAGLIITEGAPVSNVARGYSMTPGIYTPEQVEGWKKVTDAVHDEGGKIFIQLWHVGRRSNEIIAGETPVSASAIKIPDKVFGPLPEGGFGMVETDAPRAMSEADIQSTIDDFVSGARNAMEAGFDGVELHGAHGYLLDQFMRAECNQRTDEYGGSMENRMRFVVELTKAVADAVGAEKVALRVSPFVTEGVSDPDPEIIELSLKLAETLSAMGVAYFHLSENIARHDPVTDEYRQNLRARFKGPIMVAGRYTQDKAEAILEQGYADMVAFGQPYITNPDLVYRMQNGIEITPVGKKDYPTFYGGGAEGYTDYPTAG